ncbi:MAG: hypothetical protein ABS76_16275 [Pelagibacterium sp. SCN 64-44]|nr:MAG: hypothetical protein ABS76_16275 [Pelagibacterium sp. SCN 64-44]
MPEALPNSLGRLPIELSAGDLAEIIVRRERKAELKANAMAREKAEAGLYQENWFDLLRLARAMTFGRKGG